MDLIDHDFLVVGGGLAGLRAAMEIKKAGYDVAILSRVHPLRSHSGAAQGGINASLGNVPTEIRDSWENHALDTIRGSDYLADQNAVEILCQEAIEKVIEMEHWGLFLQEQRTVKLHRGLLEVQDFQGPVSFRTEPGIIYLILFLNRPFDYEFLYMMNG